MVGTYRAHIALTVFYTHHHAAILIADATILDKHTFENRVRSHFYTDKLHHIGIRIAHFLHLTAHALIKLFDALVVAYHVQYIVRKQHTVATGYIDTVMITNDGRYMYTVATTYVQLSQCLSAPRTSLGQRQTGYV